MSNVFVDKNKIDILANAISVKSGEPLTLTLDEMVEAVDGIETGGITPTGNINIAQAGTTDVTNYATATVTSGSVTGPTSNFTASSYATGSYNGNLRVTASNVSTTPTVSAGYVSSATPSSRTVYVPTSIPYNPSITVSGDTVTIPKGYYNSSSTKTVASGSLGVPTNSFSKDSTYWTVTKNFTNLTPGWFSNLSDITTNVPLEDKTITPSTSSQTVTPTGDTYYLNSVTVDAMPSGTAGTPTATKGTVSNHSVSVTPSVTNTTGYITGSTKTGTPVTVSASELVSGSQTITSNQTVDVTNLAELVVNVGGGGIEYESGTWTPSADTSRGTIAFTNTHTTPPLFIMLTDDTQTLAPTNSNLAFSYNDHYRQVVHIVGNRYGYIAYMYATNDTGGTSSSTQILSYSSDMDNDTSGTMAKYYAKATEFYPSSNSASRYWRANRTYKWVAVWAPTT